MSKKLPIGIAATLAGLLCLWLGWPDAPLPVSTPAGEGGTGAAPVTSPLASEANVPAERTEAERSSPVATPADALPPMSGRLTGRIVDAAANPVHPARVYVLPWRGDRPHDDHVLQDDVDELGRFAITPTFDGDVLVVAIPTEVVAENNRLRLQERLVAAATRAQVNRREQRSIGDLALASSVTITGTVRMPDGASCAGVYVGWSPDADSWGLVLDAFVVSGLPDGAVHVDVTRRAGGNAFSGGVVTDAAGAFTIPTAAGLSGYVYLMNQGGQGQIERLVRERKVTAPSVVDFDLLAPSCVRVQAAGKPAAGIVARIELDLGNGAEPAIENYRADDAGELRILREREARTRGRILRAGREPLEFEVPADATPAHPLVVELGTAVTTPVQIVLTSERPLAALSASLSRLGVQTSAIQLQGEPGKPLLTMRGDAPPGSYRLHVSPARGAEGDDAFVLRDTQDVTVAAESVPIAVRVRHGGRIGIHAQSADGQLVPGKFRLVDAAGKESAPSLHAPGRGNGQGGELWAPGRLFTAMPLPPGRYEVVVDLGVRGTHRRFVDVRPCEFAEVSIPLP